MKHKIHRRFFIIYFADACRYVRKADVDESAFTTRDQQEEHKMYIRSAIIHCALALEAAANACLDVLRLQKGTHEEYDKLQTLAKFDLFLSKFAPGKGLDREHVLVRPIRNLLTCRNTYVHSKVFLEEADEKIIQLKSWEPLGLPKNQHYWQAIHAVKALTVTSDFLNFLFFEICHFNYDSPEHRGIVSSVLGSVISSEEGSELEGGVTNASIREDEGLMINDVAKKYDLQFAFTGVYASDQNGVVLPKRKWGNYLHCDTSIVGVPFHHIWYNVPTGFGILSTKAPPKKKS
jgi:hypothetical protein